MCERLLLHDPPKFTQFGNFGLKIYHLATLDLMPFSRNVGPHPRFHGQLIVFRNCLRTRFFLVRMPNRGRCYAFLNIFAEKFGETNWRF
jgi:hypothetical protein